MSEVNKELSALLDEFPKSKFDFVKFIQTAKERGIPVSYADLRALSHHVLSDYLFPEFILNFIVSLLKDFHPNKMYDPDAKTGSLLSFLVEKFQPKEGALGIIEDLIHHEITEYLTTRQNISWEQSSPSLSFIDKFLQNAKKEEPYIPSKPFDFIVCVPQFGIKNKWTFEDEKDLFYIGEEQERNQAYEENILDMHDEYELHDNDIASEICLLGRFVGGEDMNSKEVGVFVVSPHFFNLMKKDEWEKEFEKSRWESEGYESIWKNLEEERLESSHLRKDIHDQLGCYIDAVFQIPNGIFDPFTSIPLYLILVKNNKEPRVTKKLFVGQLSEDETQNEILLQNYRQHKTGRIPQQGILIEESEFKGLDALINDFEIKKMAMRSGLIAHPYNQITIKTNFLINPKMGNRFSESTACVYAPLKGDTPVVTSPVEFTLSPQEYVQIVYKPNVRTQAFADFFNSDSSRHDRKFVYWNLVFEHSGRIQKPFDFLAEYIVEINFCEKENFQDIFFEKNCVYLPITGSSPAVTSTGEFVLEQQEYLQIVLDPNKVVDSYFAIFLNSQLGLKIRAGLFFGLKTPKINKEALEASAMYLPDIETQKMIAQVNSDIDNLSAELSFLRHQLWDSPREAMKIEKRIKQFSQEKSWEIWLEDLPFPMASILWAYLSTVNPKDRLEHISHFFEATSQFFAMICLSAVAQDKNFYHSNQRQWIEENPKDKGWYKNMTFGSWRKLHSSLAKFIRVQLSREDTKSKCLSLFGNVDEHFLQIIAGKRLIAVFETANEYRNHWIGHRGRLSDEDAGKQAAAFEDLLSKMREVMGDSFSQVLLLSPKSSEYADGIYEYTVKAIKGTRTEFREQVIQSIIPLDKKKLYILPELQYKPIEMLPFGKLMHSPKTAQNAFYFYSRFDNEGVRWVSYHFEDEPDMKIPDPEMVGLMKDLFDGGGNT